MCIRDRFRVARQGGGARRGPTPDRHPGVLAGGGRSGGESAAGQAADGRDLQGAAAHPKRIGPGPVSFKTPTRPTSDLV